MTRMTSCIESSSPFETELSRCQSNGSFELLGCKPYRKAGTARESPGKDKRDAQFPLVNPPRSRAGDFT